MPTVDRYRIPRAILGGLKAGIQEWQTLREKKKQEVMTKALLGLPLSPDEEKLLTFRIPPELTQLGKSQEETRRWEEEMGYKRELLKIKGAPKAKLPTEDILKKKDIEKIISECQRDAIGLSKKKVYDRINMAEVTTIDPDLYEKNLDMLLRKRGLGGKTPLDLKKYLPFLGAYPYTPGTGEPQRPSLDEIFGE